MPRSPRDPHDDPRRTRSRPAPAGPVPTIGALMREDPDGWFWVYCSSCSYYVPMLIADAIEIYGAAASSDAIREGGVCPSCGHQGVTLRTPSWSVYAAGGAGPARYPRHFHEARRLTWRGPFHFKIKKRRDTTKS